MQASPGYQGYRLGDVVEDERQNLSVVVVEDGSRIVAFNETAAEFVGGLDPRFAVETPTAVEGDLLVAASPQPTGATPDGSATAAASDYVTVRIYLSSPGKDPTDSVPLLISEFVPILRSLPGFQGFLWFLCEGGFASISLFDTETSAKESTSAAANWSFERFGDYTDGSPQAIDAAIVFADLPILAAGAPPT